MDDQAARNGLMQMLHIDQYNPPDVDDMKKALKGYDGPPDFKTMYWWKKGQMSNVEEPNEFKQILQRVKRRKYAKDYLGPFKLRSEKEELKQYLERHTDDDFEVTQNYILIEDPKIWEDFYECVSKHNHKYESIQHMETDRSKPVRHYYMNELSQPEDIDAFLKTLYDIEQKDGKVPFKINFSYAIIMQTEIDTDKFIYEYIDPNFNDQVNIARTINNKADLREETQYVKTRIHKLMAETRA
jgi:hypothetical protein